MNAPRPRHRSLQLVIAALLVLCATPIAGAVEPTSKTDERLKAILEQFPWADDNMDGILTMTEAKAAMAKQPGPKKKVPAGKKSAFAEEPRAHSTKMVPMRDGVRLATDIYLPKGDGPFPVVLERTPYSREKQGIKASTYVPLGYVFVVQDWRGLFGSEGSFNPNALAAATAGADGYDTVEWIATRPWCNGKVGVFGASGPGIAALQTMVANPPHLMACSASVATIHPGDRDFMSGGVPQLQADSWMAGRGMDVSVWPKPRAFAFHPDDRLWPYDRSAEKAASRIPTLIQSGWYDLSCAGAFEDMNALDGKDNRLIMYPKAHGQAMAGKLKYSPPKLVDSSAVEWFDYWLRGQKNGVADTARFRYFLMGDTMAENALGNVWKESDVWPVPSTPRAMYLTAAGGLSKAAPKSKDGSVTYTSDPSDPVPTIGGPNLGANNGPQDQRPLRGRKDVVYFKSQTLHDPVAITGRATLDLFFSADVPDTSIMVKLIDIYPNGYEALQVDSACMARFHDGFDKPSPLVKDKVYKLSYKLTDTALVFDVGHRIGVIVAGSNTPRYEVHPHSYDPVMSYDDAPTAQVSIYTSADYPSQLTLPIVSLDGDR